MFPELSITNPDGTKEVLYTPTPKQMEFHSHNEINGLFVGARGTGKSVALRWEAHIRALSHPGFNYLILRRTYPELQKSHLMFIASEMKKLGGYYHHTDKIAYYPNGSKGFFSHCQSEEDVLNLLSSQFDWMGFDELSTFPWDMFTKLSASCRTPKSSGLVAMIRACTNPLGVSASDVNRHFVTKDIDPGEDEGEEDYDPSDWFYVKATLDDNPHIDKDQYRKRFSGMSAHVRKAWLEGDFVLENALFDFYPTKEGLPYHVIPYVNIDDLAKKAQIYRVFDMGYFPDPAYCAWIAHLGHRYIVFHEQRWYKTIAADIADQIKQIDQDLGITRVNITYADPTIDIHTGADIRTIKDTMEAHGIPIECSVNKRELYAAQFHTALAEEAEPGVPRLQIYCNGKLGCPYLVKTIPEQRFDPKNPMRLDDHPDDHAVVAVSYFLISGSGAPHNNSTVSHPVKKWLKPKGNPQSLLGNESVKDYR